MHSILTKISLREIRLLFLGAGAVSFSLISLTFVVPNANSLRQTIREVTTLQTIAQDGDSLSAQLARQHESNDEIQYKLQGDMANLPIRQVEAYIIGRLQHVSWNNEIELVSVAPATGDRLQIFQEMLFNVQLAGQYEDLYRWLLEAREELGFVVVKEYTLTRQDAADQQPRLLANLSLATYRAVE